MKDEVKIKEGSERGSRGGEGDGGRGGGDAAGHGGVVKEEEAELAGVRVGLPDDD